MRLTIVILLFVTLGGAIWFFAREGNRVEPVISYESIPMPREVKVVEITPEVLTKLKELSYQAAREGDTQTLKDCLEAGVPLNEPNSRGDTLLILAGYHGHDATVEFLLKQPKIDLEVRNKMGLTALSGVAFKGHLPVGKRLLDAGAKVNASNSSGQTPLMFASLTGRTPMVRLLLEAGADPAAKDSNSKTALNLAEEQGAEDTVQILKAALKK
jgi:ankyrin repeat protein